MGEFSEGELETRESAIAAIESATKSILERRQEIRTEEANFHPLRYDLEYPVADLLGRCFLRVCFWADLFTSWTRRGRPLQLPHSEVARTATAQIADPSALSVNADPGSSTISGPMVS